MGSNPPISVWVILLNWNGLEDTLACLESLERVDRSGLDLHILLVDNHSEQDPGPIVAARHPAVEVVRMGQNLGFTGGNNYGMRRALEAGAAYVLLLNNDTLVDPGFLQALVGYARGQGRLGAAGPLTCFADNPERICWAGSQLTVATGYAHILHLGRPRSSLVGVAPYGVDMVSGTCMLLSAAVLREVGLFDDSYFAYYEDADLSLRIRGAGYETVCVPGSLIWHRESASTRRGLSEGRVSPFKHYLFVRNRIRFVRRHGTWGQVRFFHWLFLPAYVGFYSLAFVARRRWEKLRWFWRGLFHGLLPPAPRDDGRGAIRRHGVP